MIRLSRYSKSISLFLLTTFVLEILSPFSALALTSGPSQPEVQSFEPVGTTDMVDMFTGDFNYNIPLMDVDGYPINIAYHGGITMDQEASWVGLGWNVNPGVINRNMRGLPDDCKGDPVIQENNVKNDFTFGLKYTRGFRVFAQSVKEPFKKFGDVFKKVKDLIKDAGPREKGSPLDFGLTAGIGFTFNNYRGVGIDFGVDPSFRIGIANSPLSYSAGKSFNFSTMDGYSAETYDGFSYGMESKSKQFGLGISHNSSSFYSSREGLKSRSQGFNVNASISRRVENAATAGEKATTGKSKSTSGFSPLGYSQTFGTQAWTPRMSVASTAFSLNLSFQYGREFQFINKFQGGSGFFSMINFASGSTEIPGYGYLYEQDKPHKNVLLDFNREKDGNFIETTSHLPLTNHTFDLYSVSGHGTGGTFRPYRGDVGVVHDNYMETAPGSDGVLDPGKPRLKDIGRLASLGLGIQYSVPMVGGDVSTQLGVNLSAVFQKSYTGLWEVGNDANTAFAFHGNPNDNSMVGYEPAYFKMINEYSTIDSIDKKFYSRINYDSLVKPMTGTRSATGNLGRKKGLSIPADPLPLYKEKRDKRNTNISYLTADEAQSFALSKKIEMYVENVATPDAVFSPTEANRIDENHKPHHISEVTITNEDGSRYIYGIPAYNNFQIEKSFSVGPKDLFNGSQVDKGNNLVSYEHSDASTSNTKGIDHYYNSIKTPAHAHSYLLTSVLSPDYVDITDDGISDDDLGSVIKINYSRPHYAYRWRVPYREDFASFSQGDKTNGFDDKGSYIYGEKEIWHLQSIVGKNHIAIFQISNRVDAYGVNDEHGGLNTDMGLYKLDRITLYAKQDWAALGLDATPIKTVHFEYDYSLCKNVSNNSGATVENFYNHSINDNANHGKLTLKKIWFTYGKSHKGRLTPYVFQYNGYNPSYCEAGHDRWGNYAPNIGTGLGPEEEPTTSEFPFTIQRQDSADKFSGAWSMTDIILPSGGKISINYESDDYSSVMNKEAMCMYMLEGFGKTDDFNKKSSFLYGLGQDTNHVNNYVFFKLLKPISTDLSVPEQKNKILELFKEGGGYLRSVQFNVLAVIRKYKGVDYHEYVRCYAGLDYSEYGLCNGGQTGYFKLRSFTPMGKSGAKLHNALITDITDNIWNYARLNTRHLLYPTSDKIMSHANASMKQFYRLKPVFLKVAQNFVGGINRYLYSAGFGQRVVLNKSWVRLNAPDFKKFGGGQRVKSIMMTDNWNPMAAGKTSTQTYGQVYEYKDLEGNTSGVAAYEPTTGNDENPFHLPEITQIEKVWIPSLNLMTDEPYGESFFPAPVVGYSRVKVYNYTPEDVGQTATGYSVNEYYTAKDFPVSVSFTNLKPDIVKPAWGTYFMTQKTATTASQGYLVELNDMHGKPKKQLVYGQFNKKESPISGVQYIYSTYTENGIDKLNNEVKLIKPNGRMYKGKMGEDIDFVMDSRESFEMTRAHNFDLDFELGGTYVSPIPFLLPLLLFKKSENTFSSLVCTKVVNRKGILRKTIAFHQGSTIETENLLFDEQTGGVIVSSVQNEFNDHEYSFTYPAHWAYEKGMGQAYKNTGIVLSNITLEDTTMKISGSTTIPATYLVPGDECIVTSNIRLYPFKAYVYKGNDNELNLILADGTPVVSYFTEYFTVKVIRSGRRNMQSTPVGQVTTLKNPIGTYTVSFDSIISSEAVEYSDDWRVFNSNLNLQGYNCGYFNYDFNRAFNLALNSSLVSHDPECYTGELIGETGRLELANLSLKQIYDSSDVLRKRFNDTCRSWFLEYEETMDKFDDSTSNSPAYTIQVNCYVNGNGVLEYHDRCSELPDTNLKFSLGNEFKIQFMMDNLGCGCGEDVAFPSFLLVSEHVIPFKDIVRFKIPEPYMGNIEEEDFYTSRESQGPDYQFKIVAVLSSGEEIEMKGFSMCFKLFQNCAPACITIDQSEPINPFKRGLKGNWRKKRDWAFLGSREYASTPRSRRDGTFKSSQYTGFWIMPNDGTPTNTEMGSYYVAPKTNPRWVWASEVTLYSPFGPELENRDALNRYSSALYGFNQSVPIAVANNAKYKQIGYEGFDDYDYRIICPERHWSLTEELSDNAMIDSVIKHSGKYSLKVFKDRSQSVVRSMVNMVDTTVQRSTNQTYLKTINDGIGLFNPDTGQYVIGAWVKDSVSKYDTAFSQPSIKVILKNGSSVVTTYTFKPSGKIIEGWQRLEGRFTIPSGINGVEVKLEASENHRSWFDDLRVHPANANMKSYSYDPLTLRLMAELDENNYASFYEYDQEGNLMRVKKETENGIATLKESRSSIKKK